MPITGQSEIPAYLRHKRSGNARCYIDGEEVWLGVHDSPESIERYDRLIAEWLANGRQLPAKYAKAKPATIAELILLYLPIARAKYTRNGRLSREFANSKPPLRHLRQLYGTLPIEQFGALELEAVRTAMMNQHLRADEQGNLCPGKPAKPLSRKYVNQCIHRIRRMFRWGVKPRLVPPAVVTELWSVESLERGEGGRETHKVLPIAQAFIDAIRPYCGRQIWAMIQLQLVTGMRPCEVICLRSCDINMTGRIWEIRPTQHKTAHFGIDRLIQIGPRGQEILIDFLKPDLGAYLFSPRDAQAERFEQMRARRRTRVQPSQWSRRKAAPQRQLGEHYTVTSYRQAIHRACDHADRRARGAELSPRLAAAADPQLLLFDTQTPPYQVPADERVIPRWNPNQLRHNFATMMRREHGIETAQILLGHTNPDTTLIYAEADQMRASKAIAELG